ncbi:uncharacterized protein LOC113238522, partial [Hyposmocoma kahamanoa]|uniref:uncharacterized protein LOC113238522 n=1 Tax=Hyposmocoma kahamanoa TaxID=1477025 RepID=UPI000E6D6ECD
MTTIFRKLLILCFSSHIIISGARNPDATGNGCSDVLQNLYISGLPDIEHWHYKELSDGDVHCNGTLKYSSPLPLKLGCHRRTQNFLYNEMYIEQTLKRTGEFSGGVAYSRDSDIFLNGIINPKFKDESAITCQTKFPNYTYMSVFVQFQYEPINTLP